MGEAFTPNREADADIIAPALAKVSIAGAVYFWLHSRAFACNNQVRVSIVFIAEEIGASRSAVTAAVRRLKEASLIETSALRGYGGGTVFSLTNVSDTAHKCTENETFECTGSAATNVLDPIHDIDKTLIKNNNILSSSNKAEAKEIISYLNEKAGRNYRPSTESHLKHIRARFREGYTADDFKKVIDTKVSHWKDDPKMDEYLKPSTLFSLKNFDNYLNQKPRQAEKPADLRSKYSAYDAAF